MSVIGGSGVRIALSPENRKKYDAYTLDRLKTYGTFTRTITRYPVTTPLRTETFSIDAFYQAAISQLDILLPALVQEALPATSTLRTITLRIRPSLPDHSAVSRLKRNGLTEGRDAIIQSVGSWKSSNKKVEEALMEAIDGIFVASRLRGTR
ncbi:hypothetical protein FRC12_013087 [Ceratobasidium sp. 428]|nr:hypothetical protein FRC12_013087 [Ceratobasidium sp. 428]